MACRIGEILEGGSVVSHFQPIVAAERRAVLGVEALARGLDAFSGEVVLPQEMFSAAARTGRTADLDVLCRRNAMTAFRDHFLRRSDVLLFLNFETSLLDREQEAQEQLYAMAQQVGVPACRVVIELVESEVRDVSALQRFIVKHREEGFSIALDDIGVGHSNLDRVAMLRPDVLKLNATLVRDLADDYFKQGVFKSMVNLARKIGALTLAEGVETEQDCVMALKLGADLLQGYHLSRPTPPDARLPERMAPAIQRLTRVFRDAMVLDLKARREHHLHLNGILDVALHRLSQTSSSRFGAVLTELGSTVTEAEHLYIVDAQGIQVAECDRSFRMTPTRAALFRPHRNGSDHSLKEHYYLTFEGGLQRFTTEPYISHATGRLCMTLAGWFRELDTGAPFLFCLDVDATRPWQRRASSRRSERRAIVTTDRGTAGVPTVRRAYSE